MGLKRVKKGTNVKEQIQAGQIVKQAEMQLSEFVILGLGGTERSIEHASKVFQETRLLIENLSISTVLTIDHYTNYLNLSGKMPEDKDKLTEAVNQALTWDSTHFRPNFIGTQ